MTTTLNQICDLIAEVELPEEDGLRLIQLMEKYRNQPSFRHQTPGFRKLWGALEEAAVYACRGDLTELPASVIKRHGLKEMLKED